MTDTMTCAELYTTDPTFAAGINKWVSDRRCPIEMGDYLEELGLPGPADCARWCAGEPDRTVCSPMEERGEKPSPSGVFPTMADGWLWYDAHSRDRWFNCSVPEDRVPETISERLGGPQKQHPTPQLAILWLLDNWVPRNS